VVGTKSNPNFSSLESSLFKIKGNNVEHKTVKQADFIALDQKHTLYYKHDVFKYLYLRD